MFWYLDMLLGTTKGRSSSIFTDFTFEVPELCPFLKVQNSKFSSFSSVTWVCLGQMFWYFDILLGTTKDGSSSILTDFTFEVAELPLFKSTNPDICWERGHPRPMDSFFFYFIRFLFERDFSNMLNRFDIAFTVSEI